MQGSDLHLDLDREQRCGVPEVVYAEGKSPEQAARAAHGLWQANGRVLVTRASADQARAIQEAIPTITHHRDARCLSCGQPLRAPIRACPPRSDAARGPDRA